MNEQTWMEKAAEAQTAKLEKLRQIGASAKLLQAVANEKLTAIAQRMAAAALFENDSFRMAAEARHPEHEWNPETECYELRRAANNGAIAQYVADRKAAYELAQSVTRLAAVGDTVEVGCVTLVRVDISWDPDQRPGPGSDDPWHNLTSAPAPDYAPVDWQDWVAETHEWRDGDWREKVEIVNLTPHALSIHGEGTTTEVPASGQVARVAESRVEVPSPLPGISVTRATYGAVEHLPDPEPGKVFVVSALVLNQCAGRNDVFAPGKAIRDDAGRIIGCDGLSAAPQTK